MKLLKKITLVAAMLFVAATVMEAQPEHNDTLRTSTWSLYVQGGIGGFHSIYGLNNQYDHDSPYLAPVGNLGVMYFPRPWIRFGLDFGYTYMKSSDKGVLTSSEVIPDQEREGIVGDLYIDKARIQNKNFTHAASSDFTIGINFAEIWRERRGQWFNVWAAAGAGYMYGWNTNTVTWAIEQNLISKGPDHMSVWNDSSIESSMPKSQFHSWYVPLLLSLEFDLVPNLTLGLVGEYKFFPKQIEHSPAGMWTAGVALRFNFGGNRFKRTAHVERIVDTKVYTDQIEELSSQVEELQKEVEVHRTASGLVETDVPLAEFAVQIYAFRIYQHAPDDKIFYGDNPTIYKNGDLRRYVLFADTIEEARAKLKSVKHKYPDAFIVTIREDGLVVPYHSR